MRWTVGRHLIMMFSSRLLQCPACHAWAWAWELWPLEHSLECSLGRRKQGSLWKSENTSLDPHSAIGFWEFFLLFQGGLGELPPGGVAVIFRWAAVQILPEVGPDVKILGGIVYWGVGIMGSRDSQGEAAELGFLHNSRRAWSQPCLTDALRVACRGKRKTGLVNTLVSLWHSCYWQVGVMPRYPQAGAFPSVQQNPAEKGEGVRPVGSAWAALEFLAW